MISILKTHYFAININILVPQSIIKIPPCWISSILNWHI